jgi:hypothetical protein
VVEPYQDRSNSRENRLEGLRPERIIRCRMLQLVC